MAAEMPSSTSPPSPVHPRSIFIDTNLDTHLAMGIFQDDTVADLKRRVMIEHVLCFPDIGEITVRAIKVRRRGTVYNLSDFMLVRSAFIGINEDWFLIVDAIPASVIQHQAGSADCIVAVDNGLPRNRDQFQTELNSSSLPNHLILADKASVPEKLALPNDKDVELDHMELGVKDKHGECEIPLQELEQTPDHNVPVSAEPVNETNEVVVPSAPHMIGLLVDQPENDAREEECGNSGVSVDGELTSRIAVKKVNTKKRKSLLQNDQAENIPVEKKKLKEGKDESSGKPFDDSSPTKNLEASHYSKKPSINTSKASLPDKHNEIPVSLEASANEALHCNLPSIENPDNIEKKKKNRSSKLHSEAESAVPSNAADTKYPSKMRKESIQTGLADEAPANEEPHSSHPLTENTDKREKKKKKRPSKLSNEAELVVPSKAVDTNSPSKMGKTSAETSLADELLDINDAVASLQKQVPEVIPVDTNHSHTVRDFSCIVPPGPLSAKLDDSDCPKGELPEARLPDQPLISEPVIKEKPADPSDSGYANLNDKSNATAAHTEFNGHSNHAEAKSELLTKLSHSKKKTKSKKAPNKLDASPEEAAGNNYNEKNMPTKLENADCSRQDLSKSILPDHPFSEPAPEDKPADPSDSKYRYLNEESNAEAVHKERDGLNHHMQDITEPATKSSHKKKTTKNKKERNKIDAPSGVVGEEKTLEKAVRKSDNDQRKDSHAVIPREEIADDRNHIKQVSEDPSHAKVRRSNQRKQTELPDQQSKQFQTPIAPDAQALEENSLRDQKKVQVEAFKRAIPNKTAAPGSDSAPIVPKKPRGSKKKSSKVDLSNHEVTVDECVPSVGKDTAEANDEGMLEATQNSLGKDSKMATVNGESLSLETPAEVHGRRSRLQKKKSEKTTEETTKGSLPDTHNDFSKKAACDVPHNADHGLIQDGSLKNSVEEAPNNVPSEIDGEPLENDVVDFIKHFVPKVSQNKSAEPQELAPMETEARKLHKEKTTKKRKSNSHPKDSSSKVDSLMSKERHQNKPEETNFALYDLADLAEQLSEKGCKSNKAENEKTNEDAGKTVVWLGNNSHKIGSPSNLHNKKIEKKLKEPCSGMVHDLMTRDEQNAHEEYPTGNLPVSGSNAKSLPYLESNDFTKPKTASAGILSAPVNRTRSGVDSDISLKEGVADRVASDDSTEEDTTYQKKRYKVAVRKIPSERYEKLMGSSRQKNGVRATSSTIFDDTVSGSSDDDAFEFRTRKSTLEDNSFTSADSDGDYMNTPGVVSAAHDKNIKEIDADGFNLSQSSNTARKSIPLSSILRSSSSYRKVKLTASQSQPEDSESQPVDMVFETQPDE